MIVDDDLDQLLLFRIGAQRSHAFSEVLTAEDGAAALNMILTGKLRSGFPAPTPDIVVTDLKMPALGGVGLARALQANPATRQIAVVMLSGSNLATDRAAASQAGCRAFFQKPSDVRRLIDLFASLPKVCGVPVEQAAL